jgi:hypothetical protein
VQHFEFLHTNQPNARYYLQIKIRENTTWLIPEGTAGAYLASEPPLHISNAVFQGRAKGHPVEC